MAHHFNLPPSCLFVLCKPLIVPFVIVAAFFAPAGGILFAVATGTLRGSDNALRAVPASIFAAVIVLALFWIFYAGLKRRINAVLSGDILECEVESLERDTTARSITNPAKVFERYEGKLLRLEKRHGSDYAGDDFQALVHAFPHEAFCWYDAFAALTVGDELKNVRINRSNLIRPPGRRPLIGKTEIVGRLADDLKWLSGSRSGFRIFAARAFEGLPISVEHLLRVTR